MARIRTRKAASDRDGIILLVVISMLVLFSLVGLAFVVYAEGQANTSRIWREGESIQQPDMDPELLLDYFLSQLLYDTTDPTSSLRGQSLARNMYGAPGNTVPFNGPGRLHTNATPSADNYYNVNYVFAPGGTYSPRDPNQDPGSPNAPYTYPDFNNMYLAAVTGSGGVLLPSYYRIRPDGTTVTLRPSHKYHNPTSSANGFPSMGSGGDVKNLPGGGYKSGPNDSIWLDLGFPVMTAPDGRKFKPLFAALIQDQDGKVNVNTHGNVLGNIGGGSYSVSHQGWHPGEVNTEQVLAGGDGGNIMFGNSQSPNVLGRLDMTRWSNFWGGGAGSWGGRSNEELKNIYAPGGHFYFSTNLDCWPPSDTNSLVLAGTGSNFSFPTFDGVYSHGWYARNDDVYNPALFNFFDPRQNAYWIGALPAEIAKNRSFRASNLEAILRYGDEQSPSLTSELFALAPQSFANSTSRGLVTTTSADTATPGLLPCITQPGGYVFNNPFPPQPFPAPPAYPSQPAPIPFPPPGASPATGEFGPTWNAVSNAPQINTLLKRIDLNRGFTNYYPTIDPNSHQFSNAAGYGPAQQERQRLAKSIFNIFCAVTGAANPATATPGTPQYDALRWLAQLSVNIVDFLNYPQPGQALCSATSVTADDVMTCFNWNPAQQNSINNGWVFGNVMPRLVVNEAYVQIANTQQTQNSKAKTATQYDINFWVELHNPLASGAGSGQVTTGNAAIPLTDGGVARLYYPTASYAGYRLLLAQTVADGQQPGGAQDNANQLLQNPNVLGVPVNIQTVVDHYTPDPNAQPTVLNGDSLNQVLPNYSGGMVNPSSQGGNQGFYVLGPGSVGGGRQKGPGPVAVGGPAGAATPIAFPGTQSNPKCFATLPLKHQQSTTSGDLASTPNALPAGGGTVNSSMYYVYKPSNPQMTDFSQLNHTIALQRLACPYLPYQPQPTQANFNPYVTVDYMLKVPMCADSVTVDGVGQHQVQNPAVQPPGQSVGRNQPFAADNSQQVQQTNPPNPNPPPQPGMPQNTFFYPNTQGQASFPYDWLIFANRPLVSPIELLQVPGCKPSHLTQRFMIGGTDPNNPGQPNPGGKFAHRAPWYQSEAMIYRALEFFEAGIRPQWTAPGTRTAGKININTIYDVQTFRALCDPQPLNFFSNASIGVDNLFARMVASRGTPGTGTSRPFLPFGAAYAPQGLQYPTAPAVNAQVGSTVLGGSSIDDTLLRTDPNPSPAYPPAPYPRKRLLEPTDLGPPQGGFTGQYWTNVAIDPSSGGTGAMPGGPPTLTRTDPHINFNWGGGSPDPSISTDLFCCRWTGTVTPPTTEAYTFTLDSDDGARLWVNGTLLIDRWWLQGLGNPSSANMNLTANQPVSIKVEHYENYGGAGCILQWQTANSQTVPLSYVPDTGPRELRPTANGHPYLRMELLNKIMNSTTTRSNAFAVWLTVGFFEVIGPGTSGGPPQLGAEINFAQNRHIRHRMFAVVDRSMMTLNPNQMGTPNPAPFWINSMSPVQQAGAATVTVPATSGRYETGTWSIQPGMTLYIDSGQSLEPVQVTGVGNNSITANFTKSHPNGFAITNASFGNPGPQPRFSARQPENGAVVKYISVID